MENSIRKWCEENRSLIKYINEENGIINLHYGFRINYNFPGTEANHCYLENGVIGNGDGYISIIFDESLNDFIFDNIEFDDELFELDINNEEKINFLFKLLRKFGVKKINLSL